MTAYNHKLDFSQVFKGKAEPHTEENLVILCIKLKHLVVRSLSVHSSICTFVRTYTTRAKFKNFFTVSVALFILLLFFVFVIFFGLLGLTTLLLLGQTNKLSERKDLVKFRLGIIN